MASLLPRNAFELREQFLEDHFDLDLQWGLLSVKIDVPETIEETPFSIEVDTQSQVRLLKVIIDNNLPAIRTVFVTNLNQYIHNTGFEGMKNLSPDETEATILHIHSLFYQSFLECGISQQFMRLVAMGTDPKTPPKNFSLFDCEEAIRRHHNIPDNDSYITTITIINGQRSIYNMDFVSGSEIAKTIKFEPAFTRLHGKGYESLAPRPQIS